MKKITALLLCLTLVLGCMMNNSSVMAAANGWVTNDDGTRSYYENDEMVRNTIKEIDGSSYYFDQSGIMIVNTIYNVPDLFMGYWVCAKEDGTLCCSEWYGDSYFGADCIRYETGIYKIGERYYNFKLGYILNEDGFTTVDGKLNHYKYETGELTVLDEGFNTIDGNTYYVQNGGLAGGFVDIDGKTYYFNSTTSWNGLVGAMRKNQTFLADPGTAIMKTYRAKADGSLYKSEWFDGKRTYFGADCAQYENGKYTIDGSDYYFDQYGACAISTIVECDGSWYYADANGVLSPMDTPSEGWVTVGNDTYYVKDGAILKRVRELIDGKYYAFDETGVLYMNELFYLADFQNDCYGYSCAREDGSLYHSEFYNDEEGIAYFGEDCIIPNQGLFTVDGKTYYSTGDGVTAIGSTYNVFDGENTKTYRILDDGTAQQISFPLDEEFTKGKVNIFSWDADLESKVNLILEQYPEYKDKVVLWNVGMFGTSQEYIDFVNEQAAQGYASIFCLDESMLKLNSGVDLGRFSALENIGITEEDYKNSYAYVKKDGMVDDKLTFMSWQATPNVFIYNKEIAEKVFGTSDSKEIQKLLATPDDFYAAAEKLKAAGYSVTSGFAEDYDGIAGAIAYAQENYTPVSGADSFAATLREKGYTSGSSMWTEEWADEMTNGKVFGFFGTTWFLPSMSAYGVSDGMYSVCEGPVNYKWGGPYVGVSGTGNDTEGDAAAAFIMKKLCCDEEIMSMIYEKYGELPNNMKAVANLISAGKDSNIAGSLNSKMLSTFDASARDLLSAKLVVETENDTPEVTVSDKTQDTLIESVFSEEEKQSGLYLEVKLTAEAIEITAVPTEQKGIIETAVKAGNMNIATVIDLNIFKILGVDETKLTNLNSPVTITIDIPEKYRNSGYLFQIARLHNNKVDMLKDLDNDPNTVTFETDRFSLYTLTYSDADQEPTETPTKVSEILFNNKAVTAVEGDNFSINATVVPADADNTKLTWSSSNTNVAVVDENGKVTVISSGNATIKASATDGSGVYKCCQVTVKAKPEQKPVDDAFFATYQGYKFYKDEAGNVTCRDSNGNPVINEFKCDGTYTYYFQADGTAMRNRLTYHPDGVHVIYFDEDGHEVFSNFHHVEKSIAGDAVDDLCFFDVYGYMYVDVMTYDKAGEKLYYVNPYGVIEQGRWFEFSDTCVWAGTTNKIGKGYGYANADGTLMINTHTYDWLGRFVYLQGNGHMK